MGFLLNLSIKKEFKLSIEKAKFINNETHKAFIPINNVFWHYNLNTKNYAQSITIEQIKSSFNLINSNIDQLITICNQMKRTRKGNPKILTKYTDEYDNTLKYLASLQAFSAEMSTNIRSLPSYLNCEDLKLIVKNLNDLIEKLSAVTQIKSRISTQPISNSTKVRI